MASQTQLKNSFVHWLSLPETEVFAQQMTKNLTDAEDRSQSAPTLRFIEASTEGRSDSDFRSVPDSNNIKAPGTPPHSPQSSSARSSPGCSRLVLTAHSRKNSRPSIKQFYFPGGVPLSPTSQKRESALIDDIFRAGSIDLTETRRLVRDVCALPCYCSSTLFKRLAERDSKLTKSAFSLFWREHLQTCDPSTRLFRVLRSSDSAEFLSRDCFRPLLEEVVERHPGLQFLSSSPPFQEKYIQTVIARIFYTLDRSGNERISLGELKRSNFISTLQMLNQVADINEIFDYFSYEHFYVIYCKFWEIDEDHDFLLSRDDLEKYGNFALTPIVINRIFEGRARPFLSHTKNMMSFDDFVIFLISEEDKTSDVSLDYWFRVCDLDGDGCLTVFELEAFYSAQNLRIQSLSQEDVSLQDYMCQLLDIVKPAQEGVITRQDLKRCKLVRLFFNMLFNLEKFIQYESRDASFIEQVRSTPEMTDWDRFAIIEYGHYADADMQTEQLDSTIVEASDELDLNGCHNSPHSMQLDDEPSRS